MPRTFFVRVIVCIALLIQSHNLPDARGEGPCPGVRHLPVLRTCGQHGHRYGVCRVLRWRCVCFAVCQLANVTRHHDTVCTAIKKEGDRTGVIGGSSTLANMHALQPFVCRVDRGSGFRLIKRYSSGTNCVFGEHARPSNETAAIH